MQSFAVRDLREHTGELVRNAEQGQYSVVSKHSKPLFIAVPFDDALLKTGVNIALADKLISGGEITVGTGAKLAGMPYADYLRHLSVNGYSVLDDTPGALADELAVLDKLTAA